MNDKIIVIIFLSVWSIFYIGSLSFINVNYIRVNKISLKHNKIPDNIFTSGIFTDKNYKIKDFFYIIDFFFSSYCN